MRSAGLLPVPANQRGTYHDSGRMRRAITHRFIRDFVCASHRAAPGICEFKTKDAGGTGKGGRLRPDRIKTPTSHVIEKADAQADCKADSELTSGEKRETPATRRERGPGGGAHGYFGLARTIPRRSPHAFCRWERWWIRGLSGFKMRLRSVQSGKKNRVQRRGESQGRGNTALNQRKEGTRG